MAGIDFEVKLPSLVLSFTQLKEYKMMENPTLHRPDWKENLFFLFSGMVISVRFILSQSASIF